MDGLVKITHYHNFIAANWHEVVFNPTDADCERILMESAIPTAADLDEFMRDKERYVIES